MSILKDPLNTLVSMSTSERSHHCGTGFNGNFGDFLLGSGFGFLDHVSRFSRIFS